MAKVITVVGVGPGGPEYVPPVALRAVREARVLVGGRRVLALLAAPGQDTVPVGRDLEGVLEAIAARREEGVVVLTSGDPGFFSLLPHLAGRFGRDALRVIPGLSSLQLAFARLALPWAGVPVVSLHGRGWDELAGYAGGPLVVLTDPQHPPAALARFLLQGGLADRPAWVCRDLGQPGETVLQLPLSVLAGREEGANSLVVIDAG